MLQTHRNISGKTNEYGHKMRFKWCDRHHHSKKHIQLNQKLSHTDRRDEPHENKKKHEMFFFLSLTRSLVRTSIYPHFGVKERQKSSVVEKKIAINNVMCLQLSSWEYFFFLLRRGNP